MKNLINQQASKISIKRIAVSTLLILVISSVLTLGLGWQIASNPSKAVAQQNTEISPLTDVAVAVESETEANAEPARYNLSSIQPSSRVSVVPGGEISSCIYFYNVDGNRTTHIVLNAIDLPDGWKVTYNTHNLKVIPMEISAEPITDVPEDMVPQTLANKLGEGINGYCLAQVVTISIQAPQTAATGTIADISIEATAKWSGQDGMMQMRQTRSFNYNVTVD